MKLLFDFFPIIAFFIAYKLSGIYIATAIAIFISLLQVVISWYQYRHISTTQLLSAGLILVLGGATLLLHNDLLIKWKPTVLYWILALIALVSQLFGSKPFIQRLMENNIILPNSAWSVLNLSWIIFFIIMGIVNIAVAYLFSTNTWVNFKLFGLLGLTLVFVIGQAFYLSKHVKNLERS